MTADPEYDGTLSHRLEVELANWRALTEPALAAWQATVERIEGRLRTLLSGHDLDRALELLRPSDPGPSQSVGGSSARPDPASRTLRDMLGMSRQLDAITEPTEGLTLGEQVARRAHEAAHAMDQVLSTLDPTDSVAQAWQRVLAYASELVKNAVARIRQFAQLVGVSSFAITFSTLPPEFSVTFTFGGAGG